LEVHSIHGSFLSADEDPTFTIRVLDYLIRTHALKADWPAPLPYADSTNSSQAALWCMSSYGKLAQFATHHPVIGPPPNVPLRSYSLLHIAVARGDAA
jgi:hypothetical protein